MLRFFSQEQLRAILIRDALKAGGAFVIGLVVIIILAFQINSKLTDIESERAKFYTAQTEIEQAIAVKSEIEKLGERDAKMYGALLSADNILPFVSAIEASALTHKLTHQDDFSTPKPVASGPEKPMYSINFTINLTGTTKDFLGFVRDLDRLPYLAGLTEMRIATPSAAGLGGSGTFTVQGTLYVTK